MSRNERSAGFTVVEMLVAVIVAALFIVVINALYSAILKSSSAERNRADASDIAYAQLRKFVYNGATPPASFSCSPQTDQTTNPNADGLPLDSGSLSSAEVSLPQPVNYTVVALAPYGCTGAAFGSPVLIRATISYGASPVQKLSHSAYVGY